jgi:hypothetical protein
VEGIGGEQGDIRSALRIARGGELECLDASLRIFEPNCWVAALSE